MTFLDASTIYLREKQLWDCVGRQLCEMTLASKWISEQCPDLIDAAQKILQNGNNTYGFTKPVKK